jgi:hypothetical protein
MNVIEFNKEEQSRVKSTLEKAINEEFESVILIGIKDGHYRVMGSGNKDRLKMIGFLEAAKMETWSANDYD